MNRHATFIGTAGWNIPVQHRDAFVESGSHLERYSQVFSAVEVNSSFYRSHQRKTWERWASAVPEGFAFCAKVPKSITHESRLQNCEGPIDRFKSEVTGLGEKLRALLIQLPPSLSLNESIAEDFFKQMNLLDIPLVLEPRHKSWLTEEARALLTNHQICIAAVDPSPIGESLVGTPSDSIAYFRLHGSPVIYYSEYPSWTITKVAQQINDCESISRDVWCIFDNTAEGHAVSNAISLMNLLEKES